MHDHLDLAPEALLDHVKPGTKLLVPIAAGEPPALLDALDANAEQLENVQVIQMLGAGSRAYQRGEYPGKLESADLFLGGETRKLQAQGTIEYIPTNFSGIPELVREHIKPDILICSVSEPDDHGFMSLGLSADYCVQFIGKLPIFVEINPGIPHTYGSNQIHVSQVVGGTRTDTPVMEAPPVVAEPGSADYTIAEIVAEEIRDNDCLQVGHGRLPNAILSMLKDRKDLGVHTELMSDGVMDLIEAGAVTGMSKRFHQRQVVSTFIMGTQKLYKWLDHNPVVNMLPVDQTNDPYLIGLEPNMVSVNATTQVDLLGQAASETVGGKFFSGSGGQLDFAIGARRSEGGRGYIVTPSQTRHGQSRISATLPPNSPVTTHKNFIDNVVTEHGIARLRGTNHSQRALRLIDIAAPEHREDLLREAREYNIISRLVQR
ncbi:MAG TPA: acetyl-CoA hydrolase/transferase family protein [Actinomycetales bacterium]|nr:acetyl-CoA hydrolase/transferase family protein [Actinomycetales bacterium]